MLGILRRQPARRLVEEIDIRGADHVQTDVQPLSLATGKGLFVRLPDDVVASLVETKLRQLAIDAAQAIPAGKVRRAKGRGEVQIFLDGEVFVERVMLGDVSDVFAQGVPIGVKRTAVEEDVSLGGLKLPGDGAHERALAASARAHHANHFAALHGK